VRTDIVSSVCEKTRKCDGAKCNAGVYESKLVRRKPTGKKTGMFAQNGEGKRGERREKRDGFFESSAVSERLIIIIIIANHCRILHLNER
jgi:hypothetical protein